MSRPLITARSLEHLALAAAMLVLGDAFLRFFAVGNFSTGGDLKHGDWAIELILACFYATIVTVALFHLGPTVRAALSSPGLLALLALAAVSALWSTEPSVVLRRTGGLAGATFFGIVLASRVDFHDQLLLLRRILRFCSAFSFALWMLKLTLHFDYVSQGYASNPMAGDVDASALRCIFGHKNLLGAMMALAILVDWHLPVRGKLAKTIRIAWLGVYFSLLIFAKSATALVAVVATIGILYAVKKFRHQYGLLMPLLTIGGLVGAFVFMLYRDTALAMLGKSADLTGRTDLWQWVIVMILKRPWLGYGYSGFWRGASDESDVIEAHIGWSPIYAHNGYLELLLSLGLVGLLIFAYFMGKGLWRAIIRAKHAQTIEDLWPLAFMIFFLIHNLGEVSILLQNSLEWALCIAVVIRSDPRYSEATQPAIAESEPEDGIALPPEPEYV